MTAFTAVDLDFADGTYCFDLRLPQIAELQEKRGVGIFALYSRIYRGRTILEGVPLAYATEAEAYAEDLFEVIRLALVGGGTGFVDGQQVKVDPVTARKLVERYCHDAPLKPTWDLAAAILMARIEGYEPPKDEPGKDPALGSKTE